MWAPVQVPSRKFESKLQVSSSEYQSKIWIEIVSKERTANSTIKLTVNCTHAKKQAEINSAETRRTKFSRNDPYLKHRVASDKYDIIFHVHNHKEYWTNP